MITATATLHDGENQTFTIRDTVKPGDLGWVIGQHGALYAAEYGWNASFEVLVAEIATPIFAGHDPEREHCWFAELDGRLVGCIFLVRVDERLAKLRMLIVDPEARGHGIGCALVSTCVDFARQAGYETVTLWTQSILLAARRLYAAAGFRLVASEPVNAFGHDLVSETWELALR